MDAAPWIDDLNKIIPKYSTNQDFAPYDLVDELESRKLFTVVGRKQTAPRQYSMSVDRYVELFHARNGFSRERMHPKSASEFDTHVRDVVAPYARRDTLTFDVTTKITWGRPSSSFPS